MPGLSVLDILADFCLLKFIHMETSITVNDQLLKTALQLSGKKTKKEVVEEALKLLIQMMNQETLRSLRGKLSWEGDLPLLHSDKDFEPMEKHLGLKVL